MQCREAIRREGRRGRRIGLQPFAQTIDVAERRGLEDIEVRVRGQQRVADRPIEPVAGEHQCGHALGVASAGQGRVLGNQDGHAVGVARVDRLEQLGDGRHVGPPVRNNVVQGRI